MLVKVIILLPSYPLSLSKLASKLLNSRKDFAMIGSMMTIPCNPPGEL